MERIEYWHYNTAIEIEVIRMPCNKIQLHDKMKKI